MRGDSQHAFSGFYRTVKHMPVRLSSTVFDLLPKPLADAVKEKGFEKPTEAQEKAIPPILDGKNVLQSPRSSTARTCF